MPQEKKKRGRREEKKTKRKAEDQPERPSKKSRSDDVYNPENAEAPLTVSGDAGDDYIGFDLQPAPGVHAPSFEPEFHGLLDPQEQEYYASVNSKMVADDFESDEDRALFIQAVYRETQGKELKVASSQSCSRYLEKIILRSTPSQLRRLFSKFLGNLTYLVRHRFGSHCCETLFLNAAKHMTKAEVNSGDDDYDDDNDDGEDEEAGEPSLSLEDLFLATAEELKPNMGFLLTDRFASHTVRVLFLVLSGQPVDDESIKAVLASKKKEKLETVSATNSTDSDQKRFVPKTFSQALSQLINSAVTSLDTTYLRALATHPTGNPVLQLLLQLEFSAPKSKQAESSALYQKLFPDESLEEDTESAKFISGLLYDPTGSHLVETLVQKLPGKKFKPLYKNVLKPKLANMAKNDIASYVAIRVLERLGKDDLQEAKELLLPEMSTLVSRKRTGLIKTLAERCAVRKVGLADLTEIFTHGYGDEKEFILNVLEYKPSGEMEGTENKETTPQASTHGSLLAQSLLASPATAPLVQNSLLGLPASTIIALAKVPASSRLIQSALVPSHDNLAFRRRFVPLFYGHIVELALDVTSSYVADGLYHATEGLHFMKETLARELASKETELRNSPFGKNVWRNWHMELFTRRPGEWRAVAKNAGHDEHARAPGGPQAPSVSARQGQDTTAKKSAIQLARERHAQKQAQEAKKRTPATSANRVVPTNA
ncbi:hypothetical protein PV10_00261 [Exophiala mesophila]|uniref:Nucleolar protein 9 n=1 Tax=Exophiala mesophila TaxID=212818 RepID=A0A0D1X3I6_EXOME|nr:uncharacterized protein PV10_00261 [Exophiala mesophila]KIV96380.1 hypothetical protein PV10_00261 [Exophiala mesophila]